MIRRARPRQMVELIRRLLPAVVCALGLGWHGEANASSISSEVTVGAAEHAEYCKCRHCRPESCCCGPRQPSLPKPVAVTLPGSSHTGNSPCLSDAPCGDPGLPSTVVPGGASCAAALTTLDHFKPDTRGPLIPPNSL